MNASIWTAKAPATWPDAPVEMTVSTLREIESCPRRWALGAAHYPELWSGRGYPPRLQLSALSGTVVHLAIELITKALVRARCASPRDPTAPRVMRDLGGYTNVLNDCIDRALEILAGSPRARRVLEFAARSLRAQVPELRMRTQTMLRRVRLPVIRVRGPRGGAPKVRGPLTTGAFPEIELRADQIGWKGKADLLVLSPDACEITDFKTGVPDENDLIQIRIYALLWSRDAQLNPARRRADRLVLAYPDGDIDVPAPTHVELEGLEREMASRTDAARQAVSRHPPDARPHPVNCLQCGVRHLCNEYWTGATQRKMRVANGTPRFTDIQVSISHQHGPSSWDAVVECCPIIESGRPILLRVSNPPLELQKGQRVRLLSVWLHVADEHLSPPDQSDVIATIGSTSEAYVVPT